MPANNRDWMVFALEEFLGNSGMKLLHVLNYELLRVGFC